MKNISDAREMSADVIDRAQQVYLEHGPVEVIRRGVPFAYEEYLRPLLPKYETTVRLNGIQAKAGGHCSFDRFVPWFKEPAHRFDDPEYEAPLIKAIQSAVSRGDTVVVIGGGWGVTATIAANRVGDIGKVIVYEGADRRIRDIKGTVAMNGIEDRMTINHAIVGDAVTLTGDAGDASLVSPEELPDCDVLEMDCEGAETNIIPRLSIKPQTLIVETHRNEQEVREQLEEQGYRIVDRGVEKSEEIYILRAERRQ